MSFQRLSERVEGNVPAAGVQVEGRSIDISCSRGAQQQTPARRSGCRTMGQTDGLTDIRPLHRLCSACYAGSVNKSNYNSGRLNKMNKYD